MGRLRGWYDLLMLATFMGFVRGVDEDRSFN